MSGLGLLGTIADKCQSLTSGMPFRSEESSCQAGRLKCVCTCMQVAREAFTTMPCGYAVIAKQHVKESRQQVQVL